jgi:MarR family transcriptional regulator, lower aerobic nicotinate degradation pathway regulator
VRDRAPGVLELAAFLELDKSSVSGLVDRAERRGLVRRASAPDDGRAVHVALTERGRTLAQRFAKQVERELAILVGGLSESERKRLSALASRVIVDAKERAALGSAPRPRKR